MTINNEWWRGAVFYQIYPRSFKDTNGNGVGDLRGIIEKLDYIASLGIDAIWISPFLQSPQADYGYDISDYHAIDPLFGDLDDYRKLLDKSHDLGMKVIMDMVLSHTSAQHPWFAESKQDKTNEKADWYVWADPKLDGTPPNNWLSIFGGPAWQYYPLRGQYYLHNFLKDQPDLNYHNPEVVETILDTCRYWLDFGVDGFRLDVINFCMHDAALRDNPPKDPEHPSSQLEFPDAYSMQQHFFDKSRPENLDFMRQIRSLLDEYGERFSLAEIGDDHARRTSAQYTADDTLLHSAYSFELMVNKGPMPPASLFIKNLRDQLLEPGNSWPSWAFSNHDVVRAPSRWSGQDYGHDPDLSKLLPILLCSLRGTAFLYQGDELGLPETPIPYDRLCDPWGLYLWPKWQGRDGCRTPMPWTSEVGTAGFTTADHTWLPIPETHLPLSVAAQEKDENSTLSIVRAFLHWRADKKILRIGDIEFMDEYPETLLVFKRMHEGQTMLSAFNLSGKTQPFDPRPVDLPPGATAEFGEIKPPKGKQRDPRIGPYGYFFVTL